MARAFDTQRRNFTSKPNSLGKGSKFSMTIFEAWKIRNFSSWWYSVMVWKMVYCLRAITNPERKHSGTLNVSWVSCLKRLGGRKPNGPGGSAPALQMRTHPAYSLRVSPLPFSNQWSKNKKFPQPRTRWLGRFCFTYVRQAGIFRTERRAQFRLYRYTFFSRAGL